MTDNIHTDDTLTKLMWNTQVFAPTHYPIELVAGESFWFFDEMGDERVGFYAQAGGGWRNGAVDTIGGSPSSPTFLPVGVKLMWLSFAESCFYHTAVYLPTDKLQQLAQQTLTTHEQVVKGFINIQFAIAPNGFVSLRAGFANHIQELATYEAEVANASWEFFALTNHFDPSRMTMSEYVATYLAKVPPTILAQIEQGKLPDRWHRYSTQRFAWHLACDVSPVVYHVGYVNGEIATYDTQTPKDSAIPSPAPAWLSLFFKKQGKRHHAMINLSKHRQGRTEQPDDDVAIFEVFRGFFSSNRPTALVVNLITDMTDNVFLTNGHKEQILDAQITTKALSDDEYTWFR